MLFLSLFFLKEEKWPPKATKAFGSLTGDKPLLMSVSSNCCYFDLKFGLTSGHDYCPTDCFIFSKCCSVALRQSYTQTNAARGFSLSGT